jgi:hypothetical protein
MNFFYYSLLIELVLVKKTFYNGIGLLEEI